MDYTRRFIFGKFVDDKELITPEQASEICRQSEIARDQLQDYPFDKVRRVMRRLSNVWKDPDYKYRKLAQEKLPIESGYSKEMIEKGLSVMAGLLDPDFLQAKLDTELRGIPVIEGYSFDRDTNTAKQWQPLGVVLHVLAGNVFTGGVGSWIEGALTRNVTVLKMSSSERVFMPLFLSSLLECDPDGVLSGATALIDYRSSQTEVMDIFKQAVDGVVVWGGEQAVRAYRDNLPARTKLIVFGPKLSLSVVTEGAFKEKGLDSIALGLAQELSIWDQNACTAPQICYVQGKKSAYELAEMMAGHMNEMEKEIPSGDIDLNAAVEIRKLRTLYEVNQLEGRGGYWSSGEDLKWSIFVDENVELNPSPLHRTIRIIPFETIENVVDQVRLFRGYVQTVGLECSVDERLSVSRSLAKFGVIRMVSLGQMAGGEIDDPHDGAYDLPQFLNLVLIRSNQPIHRDVEPIDRLSQDERLPLLDASFRRLVDVAKNSPYYGSIVKKAEERLGRDIDSLQDLSSFPVLTRSLMEENMPPQGDGLKSLQKYTGGYVSRSGGSTGVPKYSIYDGHDWEAMISNAERLLLAAGLEKGDRLANCMIAGDLYGSFVSFDHIVHRLGVTSFAFSTKVTPEVLADTWSKFQLNAIQGVPAFLIPLLHGAYKINPEIRFEKFIFAGQALSRRDEAWLRENLGVKVISSIIGANDGGQIAFQCQHLSGAEHHLTDDFNYIELVDADGKQVPDGEAGDILITSLHKYAFPLIRYSIGDRAKFIKKRCECGRTNRVIEYLGRSDNMFSVGFMNLDFKDIQKSVSEFAPSVVQVVIDQSQNGLERLMLRIELPDDLDPKKVRQTILKEIPVIQDRLTEMKLESFEVQVYKPGQLPRDERSSKVKSFLDLR